jgi:hypothetical protein
MGFFKKASRLRKILLIFATLFLLLIGFITYKVFWDPENTKQVFYPLSQEDRGLLRHGDIILRKGYGMFSDGLVEVQDGPYRVSHCAMILNENQNWKVVHALSSSVATFDGAQRQNLQRFLNESIPGSVIVVRFKSTSIKTKGGKTGEYRYWTVVALGVKKLEEELEYYNGTLLTENIITGIIDRVKNYLMNLFQKAYEYLKSGVHNIAEFFELQPEVQFNNNIDFTEL